MAHVVHDTDTDFPFKKEARGSPKTDEAAHLCSGRVGLVPQGLHCHNMEY